MVSVSTGSHRLLSWDAYTTPASEKVESVRIGFRLEDLKDVELVVVSLNIRLIQSCMIDFTWCWINSITRSSRNKLVEWCPTLYHHFLHLFSLFLHWLLLSWTLRLFSRLRGCLWFFVRLLIRWWLFDFFGGLRVFGSLFICLSSSSPSFGWFFFRFFFFFGFFYAFTFFGRHWPL